VVLLLWATHPLAVLFGLALLYGAIGAGILKKLVDTQRSWKSFGASLDQIQKDLAVLEKSLS
jgi:hypothetical protein